MSDPIPQSSDHEHDTDIGPGAVRRSGDRDLLEVVIDLVKRVEALEATVGTN